MILFLKILMFLIMTPIFLLIKLLSPVYLIRWHEIPSERIGHLAIESELYLCEKNLSINTPNKPFLDIFSWKKISNNFLLKLYSKSFLFFKIYNCPLCRLSREFSKILNIKDVHEISNNTSGSYDSLNLIDQNPSFLNLQKK